MQHDFRTWTKIFQSAKNTIFKISNLSLESTKSISKPGRIWVESSKPRRDLELAAKFSTSTSTLLFIRMYLPGRADERAQATVPVSAVPESAGTTVPVLLRYCCLRYSRVRPKTILPEYPTRQFGVVRITKYSKNLFECSCCAQIISGTGRRYLKFMHSSGYLYKSP